MKLRIRRVKKWYKRCCYYKVKSRYSVWPCISSGALVKCRKVGAANWGNSKKEEVEYEGENLKEYLKGVPFSGVKGKSTTDLVIIWVHLNKMQNIFLNT